MATGHSGGGLPESFVPVEAFLCADDQRQYPGDGTWSVLLGGRVTSGLDAIVSALRKPAQLPPGPATPDPGSTVEVGYAADLVIGPNVVLYDAAGDPPGGWWTNTARPRCAG